MSAREVLASFDVNHIPNLDVAVLGALELFSSETLPKLAFTYERPLVLGSGNAYMAAQIIFADTQAVFADESSFEVTLQRNSSFDVVVVMSASGGKHAKPMVETALQLNIPVHLITCNEQASAATLLAPEQVHVFPKNREPYTYNTSTYLGPLLAHTGESVSDIENYIHAVVEPRLLRNFADYDAFTFLLPKRFLHLRSMLSTKFDELFGPCVNGRFFTPDEILHAKTVVVSGDELFISFGCNNTSFGVPKNRLEIPVSAEAGYGMLMAATYFVVGKIQTSHPPYFANSIATYAEAASKLFGQTITPIVE